MKPVLACVDDNLNNLEFYKDLLSDRFEVETFQNSVEFDQKVNDKDYDCYLFDLQMPVLNGFDLLGKIRSHPLKKNVPVFIITTSVDENVRLASYLKGASDFIDRFIKTDELIIRLESRISSYKNMNQHLKLGNLHLDQNSIDCFIDKERLILTLIEFKILSLILQTYPMRISKSSLISSIWGKDVVNANNINTHLFNLRLKLVDWNYELRHDRREGFGIGTKQHLIVPA